MGTEEFPCCIFCLISSGFRMRHSFGTTDNFSEISIKSIILLLLFKDGGSKKMHMEPKFHLGVLKTVIKVLLSTIVSIQ